MGCFDHYLTGDAQIMIWRKRESCLASKEYAGGTFTASVVDKRDWEKLMNNKTMISDDELFFEEKSGTKVPARKGVGRGKKSSNDLFGKLKIKMVMRIYGVTRARAMEIIAGRAEEAQEMERAKNRDARPEDRPSDDEELMSAAEFFGAD